MAKKGLFLIIICLLAFVLVACTGNNSADDGVIPEWVLEHVSKDREILWAYENSYFLEEPIIVESEDFRWTVWAVLSDDVSTRVVLSIETNDESNPSWMRARAEITKIDGISVNNSSSGQGSNKEYVLVAETPASELGEHVLTLQYVLFTSLEDEGTIVNEKEIPFNNESMTALNTTFQVEESIQIDAGSITIDKVVYTPSMIHVLVTPGSGVELDYGRPEELGPYLEIDEEQIVRDGYTHRMQNEKPFSYYISYPKPDEIMEIQMVTPALIYDKEINMTFASSDIGITKSSEGLELTLQDWHISDEGLELDFHNSGTEDIRYISGWDFTGIDQRPNRISFNEKNENHLDWTMQFGIDGNPNIWEQVDAIAINNIRTVQEGPWMIEFPVEK